MATNYQVISQAPDLEVNPSGTGFMNVWKVTYKVTTGPAKGTVGTATFPDEEHTADQVGATIGAKVAELTKIASLGT